MPSEPATEAGVLRVSVFVPTYRRPDNLRAMLPLLLAQARDLELSRPAGPCSVDVLVVDNDPAESALDVVASCEGPVRYVAEPSPGVSAVRNRAFDETSGSDLLCCIDDDELPADGWLEALVCTWFASRPAAVCGRVVAENWAELDPFIRAGGFFVRRDLETGTPLEVVAAGNLLVDLNQIRAFGVRFDERLGLTGGEDILFSKELLAAGGRMVWCAESIATELVPPSRASRQWVLRRQLRVGNSQAVIDQIVAGSAAARLAARARWLAAGTVRIFGGLLVHLAGRLLRSRTREARGLRAAYRGTGMVAGAAGLAYVEYGRGSSGPWQRIGRHFREHIGAGSR